MGCGRAGTRAARAKWRSEGARRGLGARAGETGRRRRGWPWRSACAFKARRRGRAARQQRGSDAAGRGDDGGVACGRQVHGRPVWALRRRGGASPCACRGVRVSGLGVSGARGVCTRERGGSQRRATRQRAASGGRQRLSAAAGARAACLNACARREGRVSEGEREEREREWRERKESPLFDLAKIRNFQWKLKKF